MGSIQQDLAQAVQEHGDKVTSFEAGLTYIPVTDSVSNGDESLMMIDAILGDGKKDYLPSLVSKFFHLMGGTNINVVGSLMSAHLVIFKALSNPAFGGRGIYPGDEIVTTSNNVHVINAAKMCGVIPVILDVDLNTMLPNPMEVEIAIEEGKTKAIFLTAPCGSPINGEPFRDIADEFTVLYIEDCGYGIGGSVSSVPAGEYADVSLFTFHSHLLGTASVIVSKSSLTHKMIDSVCNPETPSPFSLGLTTSPMMLGYIDSQMGKLEYNLAMRMQNWSRLSDGLSKWKRWLRFQTQPENAKPCWSEFCITLKEPYEHLFTKAELMEYLEEHKVGCRHVVGNVLLSDGYKEQDYRQVGELMTSSYIHQNSFVIGCHANMTEAHTKYVISVFDEFMKRVEA